MDIIDEILTTTKVIAVVGLSPRRNRASHGVAKYLQYAGYRIIPVNPNVEEVLGEKSYPDLRTVPVPVDLVDIFRRPDAVVPVVKQAIEIGARYIWMQDGVVNEEAARLARRAGIPVVMENCTFREHVSRFGPKASA
ncbi:MAG: CoA-binding protein [SAR202 cluster bacterium]|nr:CoA-binding protein [SAR202 cluster bacterium]